MLGPALPWRHAVIIDDDERLATRLRQHLHAAGLAVHSAGGAQAGIEIVRQRRPDLVLLDFRLPDGDGREVIRALQDLSPWPTFMAMSGCAEPLDSFELARLGVHGYLPKPFTPKALETALERVREQPVHLVPALRTTVGRMAVHDVEALARRTMVEEALARSRGSRSAAARLLKVSRQLLQHMLRSLRS